MTEHEILQSPKLKRRFCKDNNIPITVYEEPYFMERIFSFSHVYDSLNRWDDFVDMLIDFDSEQAFFEYCNQIEGQIITDITASPEYQAFNITEIFKLCNVATVRNANGENTRYPIKRVHQKNVYIPENDGKRFISIDMNKANFNALRLFDERIFGCKTWEEFMRRYTEYDALVNSKYLRQVIFGKCNPKRIINYEKLLMEQLAYSIEQRFGEESPIEFYSISGDEIIIINDEHQVDEKKLMDCINNSLLRDCVKVTWFSVHMMRDGMGYCKSMKYMNYQFKCVNADILPQVVRYYQREPVTENDLVFSHEGNLAKFLQPIPCPWG